MRSKKIITFAIFFGFAGLVLFLTFNKHSKSGFYNYHSEIWSDKAGYYIYLPSTFIYNFDTEKFFQGIEEKTGNGFLLDHQQNKIRTKYTYGVAFLQMPFFLTAHVFSNLSHYEANGFAPIYQRAIDVAAVLYLVLGMFFLFKFLSFYFKNWMIFFIAASFFLGTNLYYYAIDETGMSHIYSFFLFSVFLFLTNKIIQNKEQKVLSIALLGFVASLIILIRPMNILFLFSFFFLDVENKNEFIQRGKLIFNKRTLPYFVVTALAVFFPQMLYWKYLSGHWLFYTYGNEGFSNWLQPKFLEVWFSPKQNGLFLYNPIYLIVVVGILFMALKKIKNCVFIFILFFLLSYVVASWWDPAFGCSYGKRNFIEYSAIFALPLGYLYQKIASFHKYIKSIILLFIVVLIVYNLKITYSFDGCFYGNYTWDWLSFYNLLTS
jgi:hypothetical protein